jgi:hypothetical protein
MLRRSKGKIVRKQDAPAGWELGERKRSFVAVVGLTAIMEANMPEHIALAQALKAKPRNLEPHRPTPKVQADLV